MKTNLLLQEFIQLSLQESTRADREGVKLSSEYAEVENYVNKGCFLHFGEFNKLGINPQSHYDTPIGIYAYPLTQEIYDQFERYNIPFASGAEFIHIFKPTPNANIITLQNLTIDDANNLFQKLDVLHPELKLEINFLKTEPTLIYTYVNDTFRPLEKSIVFRQLGIDGIIDMGDGIIHNNEPTQAVFFSKNVVQQLEVIWNPIYKRGRQFDIETARQKLKPQNLNNLKKIFELVQSLKNKGMLFMQIVDDKEFLFRDTKYNDKIPGNSMIKDAFYSDDSDEFFKLTGTNIEKLKQKLRTPTFK